MVYPKLTTEHFIQQSIKTHGDKYDYSKAEYVSWDTKITIICRKHGEFKQSPWHHSHGYDCPLCEVDKRNERCKEQSKKIKIDASQKFIDKARKIHGNRYEYPGEYTGSDKKIKILCKIHGIFEQRVYEHLKGGGCQKCGRERSLRGQLLSNEKRRKKCSLEFTEKLAKIHNNYYKYNHPEDYVTAKSKIRIQCPLHGEFKQGYTNHYSGHGCPICNLSHGEREIWRYFKEYGIEFEPQKIFDDCKGDTLYLMFDFYLPKNNMLIEYDGEQHYNYIEAVHKTKEKFEQTQRYDKIKNDYAQSKGIELIRIRYDEDLQAALDKIRNKIDTSKIKPMY
jgi:very-short-patch-repair endonuclease